MTKGICNICGQYGPLSKEHIPPQAPFKDQGLWTKVISVDDWLSHRSGRVYQGGYYQQTLCEKCNNKTGSLYGSEFAGWSKWGFTLLDEGQQPLPRRVPAYVGYPARIAKQVVTTMLASSYEARLGEHYPHLREFVLNPHRKLSSLRLRTYLCPSASGRITDVAGKLDIQTGDLHILTEFALPPFGYILTLDGKPKDDRPVDIGWFAACGYEQKSTINLPYIPVLPTHLPFPEDYRSKDEIRCTVIKNILASKAHPDSKSEASRIMAAGGGPVFFAANGEDWSISA